MKYITTYLLILFCAGCVSSRLPQNLTDDDVRRTVFMAMQQIYSNLKELKTQFPQLADIDSAQVTSNRFHYSRGFVSDSKIKGTTFQNDGCDIGFWIAYPATSTDIQQLVGSPFMRLGNGKYLVYWTLVRAERNEQADKFKEEVNRIISKNISNMLDSLGHKKNDHVFQLPME